MDNQFRIPVIKLRGNLIVTVQTALSDRLVVLLKDDITSKILETRPRGLVIDLTGIDIMDSYISRAVRDIGLIAKLMGVKTIISGMDPMIAMTLIEMDMDLVSVKSALDLEDALDQLTEEDEQKDLLLDELLEKALFDDKTEGIG